MDANASNGPAASAFTAHDGAAGGSDRETRGAAGGGDMAATLEPVAGNAPGSGGQDERFPRAVRFGILLGGGAGLWALLLWGLWPHLKSLLAR